MKNSRELKMLALGFITDGVLDISDLSNKEIEKLLIYVKAFGKDDISKVYLPEGDKKIIAKFDSIENLMEFVDRIY